MTVHVFGIRHHGPGSARSLEEALLGLAPDAVLVEGPPDAEDVLPLLVDEKMKPPVALLVTPADAPHRAVYYPFAVFSPEWRALRYALTQGVPARFIDLPQEVQLAMEPEEDDDGCEAREDPLGLLAEAAGYGDRELWWEHQVEQRTASEGLFDGIRSAMTELRREGRVPPKREALREAHMRMKIRAAEKEGFQRIAVVCGAWHAPVLTGTGTVKADQALLRDLPKAKVATTWIPWTNSRLSYRSGYGAGIESPGWYQHLWSAPRDAPIRWMTEVARLLRDQDLDASPASIIEGVRLAEALAALRGIPMAGLRELNEAALTVLCHGEPGPMALIRTKLEVGEVLGEVPENAPAVPLQRDLEGLQKRLRMKPSAERKTLDLDLREDNDRERSALLRRLVILGVGWGKPEKTSGKSGTFHELWSVQWEPEFAVRIVEANVWGNTVESAASARASDLGRKAAELPEITELLDAAILASLPGAVENLLLELQARAALSSDVRHLMEALPPLARIARYGDVRGTKAGEVRGVLAGLFERVTVGLLPACGSLDDAAATAMAEGIAHVREAVGTLDDATFREEWSATLGQVSDADGVHGLVRGFACRLLVDSGDVDPEELGRRARLSLAKAVAPAMAAAWVEGLLKGSGLALLHQDGIWRALDEWLVDLSAETFVETLPLVRRAFSSFTPPERRQMGEKVRRLSRSETTPGSDSMSGEVDEARARRVLPVLARILGTTLEEGT